MTLSSVSAVEDSSTNTILTIDDSISSIPVNDVVNLSNSYKNDNNGYNDLIISNLQNSNLGNKSNLDFASSNATNSTLNSSSQIYTINSSNFNKYFENGSLKSDYAGSTLIFKGNFVNMGVITINYDNTRIIGVKNLFNNTALAINSQNVIVSNLTFILDNDFVNNSNAGILISKSNVVLNKITMNYTVPNEITGFGIYAKGSADEELSNITLIDSNIYFKGNSLGSGWNYAVIFTHVKDAIISNNRILGYMPMRAVDWSAGIYGGISMDPVAVLATDSCENLLVSNNYIYANVTGSIQGYPTLDCCIIYACDDAIIDNNTIIEEDFYTKNGTDNYLYALDLYRLNNVTIINNNIHVNTTGGKVAAGTAYPIQVSGPAYDIKIAFNNIRTYSNGPNIGIYSHNYYGSTQIDIISNNITVAGVSSTHSWALVAGIEVQDSDDKILNNTIRVTNVGDVSKPGNIYGISYSQSTSGEHTFNIQFNDVETNGNTAVVLKSDGQSSTVVNSIIANNKLVAKYEGSKSVSIGAGYNNTVKNNTGSSTKNRRMPASLLPSWLSNYHTGNMSSYMSALNNYLDGLVNKSSNTNYGNNNQSYVNNNSNSHNNSNSRTGINGSGETNNSNSNNRFDSLNNLVSVGGNIVNNVSQSNPGLSDESLDGKDSSSENSNSAYEVENVVSKTIEYLKIVICLIAVLLFAFGFKRSRRN